MHNLKTSVLTMCNHKGGTGKTTSVLNIGAGIGLSGYKVLLVDLDPQGFLTRMVGIAEPDPAASSAAFFSPSFTKHAVSPTPFNGFDVIPASRVLTSQIKKLVRPIDNLWVKEAVEVYDEYDLILLDTAAAVTVYSLGALVAASLVVIPVTPEMQPVHGAERAYESARIVRKALNPDLIAPYFLLTQTDARKTTHHRYRRYLRSRYQTVLKIEIRTNAALARVYDAGKTVFECNPRSRGAQDYANAADEIIQILGLDPPTAWV